MEKASLAPMRVFIVEDSVPIRERLADLVGATPGLSVVGHAETPESAIQGILRTRADSVVLDINLLGGSGLEVLKNIRSVSPETVFVVLTNYPTTQYRNVFMKAGARAFLDKTTEFEKVPAALIAGAATVHAGVGGHA